MPTYRGAQQTWGGSSRPEGFAARALVVVSLAACHYRWLRDRSRQEGGLRRRTLERGRDMVLTMPILAREVPLQEPIALESALFCVKCEVFSRAPRVVPTVLERVCGPWLNGHGLHGQACPKSQHEGSEKSRDHPSRPSHLERRHADGALKVRRMAI
jgi:hypothetical protein